MKIKFALNFLLVFLYSFFWSFGHTKDKIIYRSLNQQNPFIIKENNKKRCLVFGSNYSTSVNQTCIDLKNYDHLIFNYQKFFFSVLFKHENPRKILMLGLGGGSFAKAVMKALPQADFDIVEINPEIYEIAKKYFGFKANKNTKVYIKDAFYFLQNASLKKEKYDIIFIDAFTDTDIHISVLDPMFMQNLSDTLDTKGIIAFNTFTHSKNSHLINDLYTSCFKNTSSFIIRGNRIILATNGPKLSSYYTSDWENTFKDCGINAQWINSLYLKNQSLR